MTATESKSEAIKILRNFVSKHRQYAYFNVRYMMFDKKTNNSCGAINFFRLYLDDKLIVINGSMMNIFDYKHIQTLVGELCACFGPFEISYKEYHYPIYYKTDLNRNLNEFNMNKKLKKIW